MGRIRQGIQSGTGRIIALLLSILAILFCAYQVADAMRDSAAISSSLYAVFVCARTGRSYELKVEPGLTVPALSPHSNEMTGYPAEACNWTRSGNIKSEPTYVLLNSRIGKPEPTFCPNCGRLVRPRNPFAAAGAKPPPTKEEYAARMEKTDDQ